MHPINSVSTSSPVGRKTSYPFSPNSAIHPCHKFSFPVSIPSPTTETSSPVPLRNSPKSWEDSLQNLTRSLQVICGSPTVSPTTPPPLLSPTAESRAMMARHHSTVTPPPRQIVRSHRGQLRRAGSVFGPMASHRTIVVRHIETHERLQDKLSAICGSKSEGVDDQTEITTTTSGPQVLSKPLLDPSSLRLKVNVAPHGVEDLVVIVNQDCHLSVETASGKIIYRTTIPEATQKAHLLCHLTNEGSLYIKERTPEVAHVSYSGTGSVCVPIVHEDETRLEFSAAIHVPADFQFDDVNVKTVDEMVIAVGLKRRFSSSMQPFDHWLMLEQQGSSAPVAAVGLRSFRVQLRLPVHTDTRSVHAYLTGLNQLIVKARLGHSRTRRLTL